MSRFITTIPIDVDRVIKLLPKRSDVESVEFKPETSSIAIHWSNENAETGLLIPIEWKLAFLDLPKGKQLLPSRVKWTPPVDPAAKKQGNTPLTEKKSVDKSAETGDISSK